MGSFMNFFQEKLVPPLVKLGDQRHLKAIRNGIAVVIPFIIVGSMFLIIANLPITGWADKLGTFANRLSSPVNVTFGVIALLASIGIGYNLAKDYGVDAISGGVISMVGFMLTQLNDKYALDTANLGSAGLFTAIVIAIFSVEILRIFVKKGLVIRLPKGVPPAIMNSFISLVPAAVVIIIIWFIRIVIGFNITAFLTLIFSPLVFALNTLPGIMVYTIFVSLLWSVGIHGDSIMGSIGEPIFLQYLAANTAAYAAHQTVPYITAYGFWNMFQCIGGTGATLGLVLLMLRSKSKMYKSIGRVSLPSGIFQINEPVIFGFPIVFNPILLIPFVVNPLLIGTLTYLLMYSNVIARPVAMVPWTMIPVIGPLLVTGGDWKAAVWSIIAILISMLIYYPFFKSAEKRQLQNEIREFQENENLTI